jgi:DNA-3-methyladenine glycosylase I
MKKRGADMTQGLERGADGVTRCDWCGSDPAYQQYHDSEWGRPMRSDIRLFEKICLEGFQCGLSWLTILRKRENFRAAFEGFDFAKVAEFNNQDVERLLDDAGIIRHRGKIEATINNAARALALKNEAGSLAAYFWSFYDPDAPVLTDSGSVQAATALSKKLSADLKKRGWKFVGPTTAYAFMQSIGLVNDHLLGCDLRAEVEDERKAYLVA